MSTQTKSPGGIGTLIGIIVVAALAGAAFQAINRDRIPEDDDVSEQVIISVVFKPSDRVDYPVHVEAYIEEIPVINDLVTHSPANWTVTIPKGAQVSVHAQQDIDGELDCLMQVNGLTVDHNHRDTLGSVRCWHNRRS